MKTAWFSTLLACRTSISTASDWKELTIRPFEFSRDFQQLEEICRNVFKGTDYLPCQASELEKDPSCSFQVLVGELETEETLLAVANWRALDSKTGFLEAVRTNERYRSRGLASCLVRHLATTADHERVFSITVRSNVAMQRLFARLGWKEVGRIRLNDFRTIAKLPGYGTKEGPVPCQNLLDALGITDLVPAQARNSEQWEPIADGKSLQKHLEQVSPSIGMMPGLWKLMGPDSSLLKESFQEGLVYAFKPTPGDCTGAVMALVQDRPSPYLMSPWVLCLAGTTEMHLYSALWHACHSSDIQGKLKRGMRKGNANDGNDDDTNCRANAGFLVVFDNVIPIQPALLPSFH